MNGIEFLNEVRNISPKSIRIILTAFKEFSIAKEAINSGSVYKFINKPIKNEELKKEIYSALAVRISVYVAELEMK
jgi:YesN/AraC family two-component response regulator